MADVDIIGLGDVSKFYPKFKSKAEADWWHIGRAIIKDHCGLETKVLLYEPITFNLPGGKYTPDFLHLMEGGSHIFVETKGTRKMGSYRSSRIQWRGAAKIHPWYTWIMAVGKLESWELEEAE